MVVVFGYTTLDKKRTPHLDNAIIISTGRIWALLLPTHRSIPNLTRQPDPTLHAKPDPTISKAWTISFHMIDAPPLFLFSSQTHSRTESGAIYFGITTWVQRLEEDISLYDTLVVRYFENICMFLSPQPPRAFGKAIMSHRTQTNECWSLLPLHK